MTGLTVAAQSGSPAFLVWRNRVSIIDAVNFIQEVIRTVHHVEARLRDRCAPVVELRRLDTTQ